MTVREVEVHGARIRAHVTGDPDAPPVVLLHGIARSLEDWAPQHERLDDDYRVISVDLPGFGLSDPLPGPPSLDSLAAGVEDTLVVLGAGRPAHLMGNSLGGAVAMRMLCRDPGAARSLTLVASAGFGREVTMALRVLAVPGLGRRLMRRFDRRVSAQVERNLFVDRALVTDERVEFGLRVAARDGYAAHFLATAKALGGIRGVHPGWRTELLARVAELDPPTLVVWGEKDLILPAAHLRAARTALPHASFHLFPGTGHMPQIERADEFAGLAREFLKQA
ncbi:alpha/beta fold hydrolase [Actinoplanes sp. NPDC049265]|uniref:alpha/beta fold hydrolase n=1 Tax=Actinoplanes sp. NPDC049265 TaxID=3363902 RepID=UPI003713EF61